MKSRIKGKLEAYAELRDAALIYFVQTGDDSKVRALDEKYHVQIPRNGKVFHAGLYKSVRYCTNIPEDIKKQAWDKCIALGFVPYIPEYESCPQKRGEQNAPD